ncbi:hypothetical protein [Phenylobacterium sp.]|jgi:hypothetical protein|uniref:hypothetical protein n=1 Tax=Phenylobacterium sp. TaxID=1871053 RepID=UPI002E2F7854|nr:hypothetical protein [Phenylobacterium sp.]HEX2560671.1 hypothetical protein [Phenylobacterium sp.]
MPIIAAAIGAAALAAQPAPQIETSVRPIEGGQAVRLTYTELASVTSPTPDGASPALGPTADLRLSNAAYAWETGIRTIALSNGVGSTSQAVTTVNVLMTIRESSK